MKVIVLGAGVIGVTTAYFLARAGHEVVVLEKNSASALGCSYANGGQLSYSHIEPWASKSSLISIIKAYFTSPSFFSATDVTNRDFWKWAHQFIKNSTKEKNAEISEKIFILAKYSKEVIAEILEQETRLEFDYQQNGTLHFFRNQKLFDSAIKQAQFASSLGVGVKILNPQECVKKEPTLSKLADENKLVGGLFYEMDASGNSMLFTKGLEKICREKYGVVFEYGAEIRNIFTNYQKITGIHTSKGVFAADKYVCALGATGNKLLKGIGINTKIYPIKGYSISVEANSEYLAPKISLTDVENKIVYSRLGDVFRAAGTVEICGNKIEKNQKHIDFIVQKMRTSFSDFGNINEFSDWCGFRPFRPNSIPLICQIKKYPNLVINAGHGSLGWTLSAASAKIAADLIDNQKSSRCQFLEDEEASLYQ